jgi:hypothetical protein
MVVSVYLRCRSFQNSDAFPSQSRHVPSPSLWRSNRYFFSFTKSEKIDWNLRSPNRKGSGGVSSAVNTTSSRSVLPEKTTHLAKPRCRHRPKIFDFRATTAPTGFVVRQRHRRPLAQGHYLFGSVSRLESLFLLLALSDAVSSRRRNHNLRHPIVLSVGADLVRG